VGHGRKQGRREETGVQPPKDAAMSDQESFDDWNGRVEPGALPPAARYCDEHADQVQTLFFVASDLVLEGAVTAAG
jgi:hypothetical protein